MPTRIEFETAARSLREAAQQVGELTVAAEHAGAADILRGGSLGRQVPERIGDCARLAAGCVVELDLAADLCDERAGIISDYEAELEVYDWRMQSYYAELAAHQSAVLAATLAGDLYYGLPPARPVPPPPPPEWADVRRP